MTKQYQIFAILVFHLCIISSQYTIAVGVPLELSHYSSSEGTLQEAQTALLATDSKTKVKGLLIFKYLVENDSAFNEAITAASKAISFEDPEVVLKAFELFEILVKKGQAIPEATSAIKNRALSTDPNLNNALFELLEALLAKDAAINEALTALQEVIKKGIEFSSFSETLFRYLFSKGKGFDEAVTLAKKLVTTQDGMAKGIMIFHYLIPYGKGINEAIKAAQDTIKIQTQFGRDMAIFLYRTLVSNGHALADATKIAQEAMTSPDFREQINGLELFSVLIQKDHAINEVLKIIKENYKDENIQINLFYYILPILIEKDKGFDEALLVAKEFVSSKNLDAKAAGLMLFQLMVQKGKALNEFIIALKDNLKSDDPEVQKFTLGFLEHIIREKGILIALDEVAKVIKNVLSSEKSSEIKALQQALLNNIETSQKAAKSTAPTPKPNRARTMTSRFEQIKEKALNKIETDKKKSEELLSKSLGKNKFSRRRDLKRLSTQVK